MKTTWPINSETTMSFEELFNKEIFKSERLRTYILTGLVGFEAMTLLVIYGINSDEYRKMFDSIVVLYTIIIFAVILIVSELLVHAFIESHHKLFYRRQKIFCYLSSFFEISWLSLLLIVIIERTGQITIIQTPAALTYFIFIVLSTLRLDFRLSVFTGVMAAMQYGLIWSYYAHHAASIVNSTSRIQSLGQGLIMVIVGIAAGFVADLIRTKMIVAWNNIRAKNEVIDLFGQQISPQIAENILANNNELSGIRKQVCVMFLDVRDFTPFVEKNEPEEVVSYLNKLFGFMIDIVQEHHGVINQFLGDGFMATFGAPVSLKKSSQHAVEASIKIHEMVSDEARKGNIPHTRLGIGLHYDEAITGNIGSSVRKQYSITGKVVIMASRIEQLNKQYQSQLLISSQVFDQLVDQLQGQFASLGSTLVKGSENPVKIYKWDRHEELRDRGDVLLNRINSETGG